MGSKVKQADPGDKRMCFVSLRVTLNKIMSVVKSDPRVTCSMCSCVNVCVNAQLTVSE